VKIKDLLHKSSILLDPPAPDKKGIITCLAAHLASINNLPDSGFIARKILEREAEVSTGIGYGIAIPHSRVGKIDRIYMAAARSAGGIDFSSIDGQPVHLIFMLISPSDASNEHVQVLSALSRIMSYEDMRKKLMAAKMPEKFLELLIKGENKYVE
jgi:mannitol/fructose-specific phosphotransferase system IIA component (Ntr-type)